MLSFDKLNNVNIGNNVANYFVNNEYGRLFVSQNFNTVATLETRDNQSFSLAYSLPIDTTFELIATNNFIYNSVPNAPTVFGNLKRLNGSIGSKVNYSENSFAIITLGIEDNTFDEIASGGYLLNFTNRNTNIDLDDFKLNFNAIGSYLSLNKNRSNSDYNLDFQLFRDFESGENLRLNLRSYGLQRDYFRYNSDFTENVFSRSDNFLLGELITEIKLSERIRTNVRLNYQSQVIDQSYSNLDPSIKDSGTERLINVLSLGFRADVAYNTDDFTQIFSLSYQNRDEKNNVINVRLNEVDFNLVKQNQEQWDNISSTRRLYLGTNYRLSKSDILRADFSVQLFQYDTPSDLNTFDRDEFNSILKFSYQRIINDNLNATLEFESINTHLVNLKATRSIDNNWNRIYRLSPYLTYFSDILRYTARYEVLANYTIFEFENPEAIVRSYSYRQVQYSDSLNVMITSDIELRNKLFIRYFQTGLLYWDSFSERPLNAKEEYYINPIIIHRYENYQFGWGGRYFRQFQRNLVSIGSIGNLDQYSIGPEVQLACHFLSGNRVSLIAWYELLHRDKQLINNFINVNISTKILF